MTNPGKISSLYCGQTDHLTNFALLLTGNPGKNAPCDSLSVDNTLAWVSLGLVAGAVLIVAFCVIVIEVRTRLQTRQLETEIAARMAAV